MPKFGLPPIAVLEVSNTFYSLGATHWYAKIICGDKESNVRAKLSRNEAKYLNDYWKTRGSNIFRYRAGYVQ